MRYVEIELEDGLAEKLENIADEDGVELEDLIIGILEDEVDYEQEDSAVESDDEYAYPSDDDDPLDPFGNKDEFE